MNTQSVTAQGLAGEWPSLTIKVPVQDCPHLPEEQTAVRKEKERETKQKIVNMCVFLSV